MPPVAAADGSEERWNSFRDVIYWIITFSVPTSGAR